MPKLILENEKGQATQLGDIVVVFGIALFLALVVDDYLVLEEIDARPAICNVIMKISLSLSLVYGIQ